jgi:hypothetical protein
MSNLKEPSISSLSLFYFAACLVFCAPPKKKKSLAAASNFFFTMRPGIKRRDRKKEMGRFIPRAYYFIMLLLPEILSVGFLVEITLFILPKH